MPGVFRVLLTILRYSDPPAFSNLAGRLFWTSPRSLCQPGCSLRWSSPKFKNSVRYKNLFRFSGTVGQIAQIGLGDMKTFVVQVVDEKRTFSPGALAASFDTDAYWHVPTRGAGEPVTGCPNVKHCWHALRLGHRLRWLCPPETVCESWGSLLHNLHNDMANSHPARLGMRLFLKAAGLRCCGHPRDERVVEEIARCMVEDLHRNPHVKRPTRKVLLSEVQKRMRKSAVAWEWGIAELSLGRGWHTSTDPDAFRISVKPKTLDVRVLDAMEKRYVRTHRGEHKRLRTGTKILKPLPMEEMGKREAKQNKVLTTSVLRARLQKWLTSDSGDSWRKHKERLAGDHASDDDN